MVLSLNVCQHEADQLRDGDDSRVAKSRQLAACPVIFLALPVEIDRGGLVSNLFPMLFAINVVVDPPRCFTVVFDPLRASSCAK
jgi:hypothetical protein